MVIFLQTFALESVYFFYKNIIEYQYVGDANALLLRVVDSKQRFKTVAVVS